MSSMIDKGPAAVILVFSRTCPHCITYMPIWKRLCKTLGRKAHMISMEADTYQKTPMASQKQVTSVPTVLYVNKAGEITEARDPRNTTEMTKVVKVLDMPPSESVTPAISSASVPSLSPRFNPPVPGTTVSESELPPLPAFPVPQRGGSPWAAFLLAAKQAAPAVALLGAYAALPARSSGLSAPRRTRRR